MNIRVITFYFNNVDVVAVRIFPRREGSGESLTEALTHIETVNQSQQLPIYRLHYNMRKGNALLWRLESPAIVPEPDSKPATIWYQKACDLLPAWSLTVIHSRVFSLFFFSALFHDLGSSILTLQMVSLTPALPLFGGSKLPADTACFQTWSPLLLLYLALWISFPFLIHRDIYFDAEPVFIFL